MRILNTSLGRRLNQPSGVGGLREQDPNRLHCRSARAQVIRDLGTDYGNCLEYRNNALVDVCKICRGGLLDRVEVNLGVSTRGEPPKKVPGVAHAEVAEQVYHPKA